MSHAVGIPADWETPAPTSQWILRPWDITRRTKSSRAMTPTDGSVAPIFSLPTGSQIELRPPQGPSQIIPQPATPLPQRSPTRDWRFLDPPSIGRLASALSTVGLPVGPLRQAFTESQLPSTLKGCATTFLWPARTKHRCSLHREFPHFRPRSHR